MALLIAASMFLVLGRNLPTIPGGFWLIVAAAGVSQILATVALLASFKMRDFAVGTVYSKSEILIVAAMGAAGLGTALEPLGWIGAALVTTGVAWLASKGSLPSLLRRAGDPAALMGLIAGAGFAGAAVGIRAASRTLDGGTSFDRAIVTLTVMLTIQTVINLAWFASTDRTQIADTARAWRPASWVGVFSLLGSIGWAWAVTLESAAKVRTLGQVELIMAFAIAHVKLGERHTRGDYIASGFVLAGVVVVTVLG
jgi:drug/metabolite transporter (DMT)-like permease